ncbi:methyltransferase-like protein 27 [Clavelina lepadiformis]|uniref:methyltransferase-like protein 27 n=1 Tax=Clavelina lepadiformis TaxID=159417 RepID=UPI0040435855
MEETKVEAALNNVHAAIFCDNVKDSQEEYSGWCDSYDKDADTLNYQSPPQAAKMFGKYCKDATTVLDVGSGTGKAAQLIREEYGYDGDLDLLDFNLNMLQQADNKKLKIRNFIQHWVDDTGELPVKEGSYDVIICVGSFVPNHIPVTAMRGMLKSLKHGGAMILTTRNTKVVSYKLDFDRVVQSMIDAKEAELVDKEEYKNYPGAYDHVLNVVLVLRKL